MPDAPSFDVKVDRESVRSAASDGALLTNSRSSTFTPSTVASDQPSLASSTARSASSQPLFPRSGVHEPFPRSDVQKSLFPEFTKLNVPPLPGLSRVREDRRSGTVSSAQYPKKQELREISGPYQNPSRYSSALGREAGSYNRGLASRQVGGALGEGRVSGTTSSLGGRGGGGLVDSSDGGVRRAGLGRSTEPLREQREQLGGFGFAQSTVAPRPAKATNLNPK